MNTCGRNAGENVRGPELDVGRDYKDRAKMRVITPDFSIKYRAYKSAFLRLLIVQSRKSRTAISTCEEAGVKCQQTPMTQGKRVTKRK
jgi:hypothetical protein